MRAFDSREHGAEREVDVNRENAYLRESSVAFTMGYHYNYVPPPPAPEPWNWSVIIKLVIALLVLIFTLVESVEVLQCVANVLMICLVAGFPVFALKCMVGDW